MGRGCGVVWDGVGVAWGVNYDMYTYMCAWLVCVCAVCAHICGCQDQTHSTRVQWLGKGAENFPVKLLPYKQQLNLLPIHQKNFFFKFELFINCNGYDVIMKALRSSQDISSINYHFLHTCHNTRPSYYSQGRLHTY